MMATHYIDWQQYQESIAQFFRQQGCVTEIEARVKGVRAGHKIDVWVTFLRHGIECKWVIECKLWNRHVPKEKVLTLKSIVDDVGADRGLIISEQGFQSGAYDATRGTNITLVTSLEEFERTAKTSLNGFRLVESSSSLTNLYKLYSFPPDNQPHSLLYKEGIVYVGNWAGCNISLVDPQKKTVLDVIDLDKYEFISDRGKKSREIRQYPPDGMAIADGKLFVGQIFSDFILVIDIETRAIIKRIAIPGGGEGQLTASPDGRRVYFASNKVNKFFVIDSATYKIEAVDYPGNGRGSLSLFAHPSAELLYIGIQRGGQLNGKTYMGGNSFLAVYNVKEKRYETEVYLAEIIGDRSDDSTPFCITYDPSYNYLYVGMFQSRQGIYRIDVGRNEIMDNIAFKPNSTNKYFQWVDPLAQAIYKQYLLSVNRNNHELVVLDRVSREHIRTIPLGEAPNGPNDLIVVKDEAVISYPEFNGLIFINMAGW